MGYVSAYAGITLPNPGSVSLHEKLGFVAIGHFLNAGFKQGSWHDVGWWLSRSSRISSRPHASRFVGILTIHASLHAISATSSTH